MSSSDITFRFALSPSSLNEELASCLSRVFTDETANAFLEDRIYARSQALLKKGWSLFDIGCQDQKRAGVLIEARPISPGKPWIAESTGKLDVIGSFKQDHSDCVNKLISLIEIVLPKLDPVFGWAALFGQIEKFKNVSPLSVLWPWLYLGPKLLDFKHRLLEDSNLVPYRQVSAGKGIVIQFVENPFLEFLPSRLT